jgi:hypothetical protein
LIPPKRKVIKMTILSNVIWLVFIPFISTIVGNVFITGHNSSVISKTKNGEPKLLGNFRFIPVLIMTITIYLILLFNTQS